MRLIFDPAKDKANIRQRGISFEAAASFEFDTALIWKDVRMEYGEDRYCAIGYIDKRLHVLVFTPRSNAMRVISLRKANKREVKRYEQETKP